MASISTSRRKFIIRSSGLFAGTILLQGLAGCNNNETETEKQSTMEENKNKDKLGIALVGLGGYSTGQLGPALQETQNCFLAGIVTGTPKKAEDWKKKYSIPEKNIYNYENFDSIRDNPDIDIVYVVLPNALHAEYVIRAAGAGKHVICEKPMAVSVEECDKMIEACNKADVKLSIGYRLHVEPHTREMISISRQKRFGEIKKVTALDGMGDVDGWRLDPVLAGGGALMDIGIYCVQAANYINGLRPVAVRAQEIPKTDKEKFKAVEEGLNFQLEYADGVIAECTCSYSEEMNKLRVDAANGWYELEPAYAYEGITGDSSSGKIEFPGVNQQALQMDAFANVVKTGGESIVPGTMGRNDVEILMKIYEAVKTGKRIDI